MKRNSHASALLVFTTVALFAASGCRLLGVEAPARRTSFQSAWGATPDRVWIGESMWANRLQDWRVRAGALECVEARPRFGMRTLHLLTNRLVGGESQRNEGSFRTRVAIEAPTGDRAGSAAGFLIGAGGDHVDYRLTSQVHGTPAPDGGLLAVVDGTGRARLLSFEDALEGQRNQWAMRANTELDGYRSVPGETLAGDGFDGGEPRAVVLELTGAVFDGRRTLGLVVRDAESKAVLSTAETKEPPAGAFDGGVALVSHRGPAGADRGFGFRDWTLAGELVEYDAARAFGPIMFVHYTVDETPDGGHLRMTAQAGPLGSKDTRTATLELADEDGDFEPVQTSDFTPDSATFHFDVRGIDPSRETAFRVRYVPADANGDEMSGAASFYEGVIAKVPDGDEMTIASLSCQKSYTGGLRWNESGLWFPHTDVRDHVAAHEPDLLYFAGDQIYEGDLTPAITGPLEAALGDYLTKWYRHGWSFGELTRRLPTVVVTDDHDVYHGNLWGNGGIREEGAEGMTIQDRGGYKMPAAFLNAVHRTQVAHLPPPADTEPLPNGLTPYHTTLQWGGGSFAILADRMYKSPPSVVVVDGDVKNGWSQNPEFDARTGADAPGATLLGQDQLAMLEEWGSEWRGRSWFRACLSQSPFANVATIPMEAMSGNVIPSLKVPAPGEYVAGDKRAADMDSNGWPQSGRDRAVAALRDAGAFHLTGDQHLGSTLRYGLDDFDDAGYVLSSPAVANTWPRRWFPDPADRRPGGALPEDAPGFTGRYFDGFGNRMTVLAVANPRMTGRPPARLHDRVPGYAIARVRRTANASAEVRFEAWPRWVDPTAEDAAPYEGWPVEFEVSARPR